MTSPKASKKLPRTRSQSSSGWQTVLVIFLSLLIPGGLLILILYLMMDKNSPEAFQKRLKSKMLAEGYDADMVSYAIAQSKHETGNYTSRLFKEQHNPWGMGCVHSRQTTQIGCSSGFGVYENLTDAADDFVYYLNNANYLIHYSSVEAYVADLKRKGYFEDSYDNYLNGTKTFLT